MQIEVIRSTDEFERLAEEWNHLLSLSASHVPFLRHEYLSAWWRTRGGGEWAQAELHIVVARGNDGALCGIAPLFSTTNRDGQRALMLLGSIEISDYLDVIVKPDHLPGFMNLLLDHLCDPQAPDWDVLDWYNLLESSPSLPALKEAASMRGLSVNTERLQHCPYIPLVQLVREAALFTPPGAAARALPSVRVLHPVPAHCALTSATPLTT